jgi:hypothetical protein
LLISNIITLLKSLFTLTFTYGAVENRPALSFCYAVIEKTKSNSTLRLLELADLNSASRMLQMVVRNYPPTDLKVAGDITIEDLNYTFLGLKLHAENGGASYVAGNHCTGSEPQKTQRHPHHRFKT